MLKLKHHYVTFAKSLLLLIFWKESLLFLKEKIEWKIKVTNVSSKKKERKDTKEVLSYLGFFKI